jgi:hypothetical protein
MKIYQTYERKTNGLTNIELREAMQLYTDKIKSEILCNLENEYDIRLAFAEELIPYFNFVIDQAMTKGMELVAEPDLLTDFYGEHRGQEVDKITKYDFKLTNGVSGVLLPNGDFVRCGNAEHHLVTDKIAKGQEFGCIYFSSRLCGQNDGVISYSPIGFLGVTQEQKDWMKFNKQFFDFGQIKMYESKIKDNIF